MTARPEPRAVQRPLVLASGSPRRQELLRAEGFEFRILVPEIDESALAGETPEALASRLALAKAQATCERAEPGACVLGADTLVVVEGRILGKPSDAEHAVAMLGALAGRTHRVLTAVALVVVGSDIRDQALVQSQVRMHPLEPEQIRAYVASGEPLDKAGAYAAQGEGGRFVAAIEGSRSNVIGLPLEAVLPRLAALGVHRRCPG